MLPVPLQCLFSKPLLTHLHPATLALWSSLNVPDRFCFKALVLDVLSLWNVPPPDICTAHFLVDLRILFKYLIESPFSAAPTKFSVPLHYIIFSSWQFSLSKFFSILLVVYHPLCYNLNFMKAMYSYLAAAFHFFHLRLTFLFNRTLLNAFTVPARCQAHLHV